MTTFVCSNCGNETSRWEGKCPACGEWNSLKETSRIIGKKKKGVKKATFELPKIETLEDIKISKNSRTATGFSEMDCVLGGGFVPGMVILLGGAPGTGKSTLMIQVAYNMTLLNKKVLYVSGEESKEQIKIRSSRLGIKSNSIYLFCTNHVEQLEDAVNEIKPDFLIIDSIQSIYSSDIDSYQGSVTQLRECSNYLTNLAKRKNLPTIIIGHITKDGVVAGPKTVEHMVDTVLYFESEKNGFYKILRTSKNRFGSTNEIGVFEMTGRGLSEVLNPSLTFISRSDERSGDVIGCVSEGSRNFYLEVQALLNTTNFGNAQRVSVGYEQKKLAMLLAVIEKHTGIPVNSNDVFINIIGGFKSKDASIDLAVVTAIFSGFTDIAIPKETVFIGEVGLNGEIRVASNLNERIKESIRLGFTKIVVSEKSKIKACYSENCLKVADINQLFKNFF
ncbi:MAG: DNA repair protein RadA [Candidatus Cloacimonetes bacterium 4572_65]|nr:MAG: DNA repair protein RadA [Candidatus Cloacimonetes bacterium 4572_65]